MANLFNTLTAVVVRDQTGTRTDLFLPSGKLFHSVPSYQAQPRFSKQRYIVLFGEHYALLWNLTPATPAIQ